LATPVIRPATVRDVAALAELAKRTWYDAFGDSVSAGDLSVELETRRSETYFAEAMRKKTILVAETEKRLIGYVQFGDVDAPGVEARPEDQELDRLYVDAAWQGRGLGRRLMNAALEHPRLAEASRIYLTVWDKNERAIRLYERLGFRVIGTTTFTIGSEVAHDLVMMLEQNRGTP
jgi:ribosomal protein S18 acetylase RimI-like enzyme